MRKLSRIWRVHMRYVRILSRTMPAPAWLNVAVCVDVFKVLFQQQY